MRPLRHRAGALLAGVVAVGATAGLTACAGGSTHHTARQATPTVAVSVTSCGEGWPGGPAGTFHLLVRDTDSRPGEARLIEPRSGAVYADLEPLAAGTTTPLDVTLRAGRYALQCLMEDEAPVTGRPVTVTGRLPAGAVAAPGVVPVDQADLVPATKAYQRYVTGQLPRLASDVGALRRAVTAGDRSAAKAAWLTGHLRYERLGAAYDAFGDLDAAIDGRTADPSNPDWTGFHRVEYGLWHGQSLTAIGKQVDTLAHDVAALRAQFATTQIDPLQIGIRAHEISENALQFALTGRDDYGSHSDLATIRADQQGTEVVLGMVAALLRARHVDLAAVQAAIHRTDAALARRPVDRPAIDAALGEQCELLAPVAAVLEPRRTS